MSAVTLFSTVPADWLRPQDEIALKVAEIYGQLERCNTIHPVAAVLGLAEPMGFESTSPVTISGMDFSDALAFPIRKSNGEVMNLLFVSDLGDGTVEEAYIPGIAIKGGYVPLGQMAGDTLHIAIDLPSSLAIAQATAGPVACAIYIDNLADVATALHAKYPDKEIIVCAGTATGPSRAVAAHAASLIGARLALAETSGTFSDCYREAGAEGVIRSLEAAEVPDTLAPLVEEPNPLDPPDPTRWPGKVNANLTAQFAVMLITRYLVTDVHVAVTMVLWALTSYFADSIRVSPLLAFVSPTKRCGKTTALGLLKSLVCRPYAASNLTAATLYRLPKRKPTLLADEIEQYIRSAGLATIINGGHTRDAANIMRVENKRTESFSTFFHKAIFGIKPDIAGPMADRSIILWLQRKGDNEIVERHVVSSNDVFAPVRACFAQLAHLHSDKVRHAGRTPIKLGNDRAEDNWEPLFAVASLLGENWVEYAKRAAKHISTRDVSGVAAGLEELLWDIKLAFESAGVSRLSTERLIQLLTADPERPWGTFSQGRPITANALAKMLRPLGIRSTDLRETRAPDQATASPSLKGYYRASFDEAFRLYAPPKPDDTDETDEPA